MGDDAVSPLREPPVRAIESRNGAVVITLAGELDLYNADEVRAAFVKALDGGATIWSSTWPPWSSSTRPRSAC